LNPRLVICLILSTVVAIGSAAWAVASGWGLLAGLLIWSVGGAICLVTTSLVACLLEDLAARSAPEPRQAPTRSHVHA
jgi:hypothetical protein